MKEQARSLSYHTPGATRASHVDWVARGMLLLGAPLACFGLLVAVIAMPMGVGNLEQGLMLAAAGLLPGALGVSMLAAARGLQRGARWAWPVGGLTTLAIVIGSGSVLYMVLLTAVASTSGRWFAEVWPLLLVAGPVFALSCALLCGLVIIRIMRHPTRPGS